MGKRVPEGRPLVLREIAPSIGKPILGPEAHLSCAPSCEKVVSIYFVNDVLVYVINN